MKVYDNYKVYGSYVAKDKRLRIVLVNNNNKKDKITVSYPKYLMEVHLNKYLEKDDTVDHIDGDFTNNKLSNLQVLPRKEHALLDVKRLSAQNFICPVCKKSFILKSGRLHNAIYNRKRGRVGPFCSRSCVGKYSQNVQMMGETLPVIQIEPKYFTNKKQRK